MSNAAFWNQRYATSDFVFGSEPNDFLREQAPNFTKGPVLCLGEGEGRNAVHLASLGHAVLAVDQSGTGLAKARTLAALRGLELSTQEIDLADFELTPAHWAGIVSILLHLPPSLRAALHRKVVAGLRVGGLYVLEAYTPAQLAFSTGGPRDPALLPSLSCLVTELEGLELLVAHELERVVIEGSGHTGRAAVVQILARKK